MIDVGTSHLLFLYISFYILVSHSIVVFLPHVRVLAHCWDELIFQPERQAQRYGPAHQREQRPKDPSTPAPQHLTWNANNRKCATTTTPNYPNHTLD